MNTLTIAFETLHFLESPDLAVIEIQRKDVEDYLPHTEKLMWLAISKVDFTLKPLTFCTMDSSAEIEERFFEEGFLKFGSNNGTYIAKFNSAQHQLLRRQSSDVSPAIYLAVINYLNRR